MRISISAFLVFALNFYLKAQDVHFSQYYQSPVLINPAFAGSANGIRSVINYKNQWASVASPYKTVSLSLDLNVTKKAWDNGFVGAGLLFYSDKAGDAQLATNNAGLSLSSGVYISDNSQISVGLQTNYVQQSINFSNLKSDNQYVAGAYDPAASLGETFASNQNSYIDFSAGLQYTYGKSELYKTKSDEFSASGGMAYYHITEPQQSFYGSSTAVLYSKIVIHGMSHIGIPNGSTSFIPSFITTIQGPSREVIIGCSIRNQLKQDSRYTGFVKSSSLLFGGHYRLKDSFILSMLYENAGYGLGISYDLNTSSLKTSSNGKGGVEISIKYVNLSK